MPSQVGLQDMGSSESQTEKKEKKKRKKAKAEWTYVTAVQPHSSVYATLDPPWSFTIHRL